jgi:pilus assembly protein Flp/PilA
MLSAIRNFVLNESGATAIEYGLIASLIALVILTSANIVGSKLKTTFNEVAGNLLTPQAQGVGRFKRSQQAS